MKLRMTRRTTCSLAMALLVLLTGCVTPTQTYRYPDQRVRLEDPQKARVYLVYRSPMGSFETIPVLVNRNVVGRLATNSFLCWEDAPGSYTLATPRNGMIGCSPLTLDAQAGCVYYVRFSYAGLTARFSLIDEATGVKLVRKSRSPMEGEE